MFTPVRASSTLMLQGGTTWMRRNEDVGAIESVRPRSDLVSVSVGAAA